MMVILTAACCSDSRAESNLAWRRGRTPAMQAVAERNYESQRKHDAAVRPAAYDDEGGPDFGHVATGSARLRSIVVEREIQPEVRSAQLPLDNDDERYEQELREPFGDASDFDNGPDMGQLETSPSSEEDESLFTEPDRGPAAQTPPTYEPLPESLQPELPPRRPTTEPLDEEPTRNYALGAQSMEEEAEKAQEFCSQELADLKASTLNDVDLSIAVGGQPGEDYPYECSIDDGSLFAGRCWPQTIYMWKAAALCHKPLYFEDEALERYGHSWGPCCQPLVSGAHFFSRLPILPYCMGVEPPCECVYALGHYRPGSCAPYMCDPIPISPRGGLIEAGAVVGAALLIP